MVNETGNAEQWPYRWELLLRYRFIETITLWEGRLTTGHLCRTFGIGRQQASKDISVYRKEIAPDNLVYDKYAKGYRPSDSFLPRVTRGTADEYLHLMTRNTQLMGVFESLPLDLGNVEQLSLPVRDVAPEVLRPLLQAARQHRRLEVDYVSLHQPDREGRIIVPHTLVFTGVRWHVRAWCEKNLEFRDFVLSRFRGEAELLDRSEQSAEDDTHWMHRVELIIEPDDRLSTAQREVVARDYGMAPAARERVDDSKLDSDSDRWELRLQTRATLVEYLLRLLQLDPRRREENPQAQQIVLRNAEELRPYLFGS